MGLDLVEAVIRIEEEFELSISDEDAGRLNTPREVVDYLMGRRELGPHWSRDRVAEACWKIFEDEFWIDRNDFNEDSHFVDDMGAD